MAPGDEIRGRPDGVSLMAPGRGALTPLRLARSGLSLVRRLAQVVHGAMSRAWPDRRARAALDALPVPDARAIADMRARAEAALKGNVLDFWVRHAAADPTGAFVTHLDRFGRRGGPPGIYLVHQARLVWVFSAAHRHGLVTEGYLDLAERGARYLVDRMWDPAAGGFVWAVADDGTPLVRDKRTYGHAFAIYALAEYAMAAGSRWALDWAARTLDVLTDRAGDGDLGFYDAAAGDWSRPPGPAGAVKTLDAHLHLVEALTALLEASGAPEHARQLRTVLHLALTRAVEPRLHHAIDERLDRDWHRPRSWRAPRRVSYGHGVELAWLAGRAVEVLGDPPEPVREVALRLIDHALRYGFDTRRGGLAHWGPPVGEARRALYLPAKDRVKHWWEQAEHLVATLDAYRWTGKGRYLAAFGRQFEWVWRHQMDHDAGEWFEATAWRDGRPLGGVKAHEWKDPYHNARALMEVARGLEGLEAGVPPRRPLNRLGRGAPDRVAAGP
jgi:mannobiose 2-epimerase